MLHGKKSIKMNKMKAGFTLIELLVAFALLVVIIIPITGMFIMSARATVLSRELMIGGITAQLRMEELVGRSKEELLLWLDGADTDVKSDPVKKEDYDDSKPRVLEIESVVNDYNGYRVDTKVIFDHEDYSNLAFAEVKTYNANGKMLGEQTNILNVGEKAVGGG